MIENIKTILDTNIDASLVFEVNKCVLSNKAFKLLCDYNDENLIIDKNILDFFMKNTPKNILQMLLSNEDNNFEIVILKNNLEECIVNIKQSIVLIEDKTYKVLNIHDLSEINLKNKTLKDQSKLVAMGEMIGNIAHQWRQPLSSMSIAASNIKINYELDMVEEDEMIESLDSIVHSTEFLSNTIDDFRDFIKGESLQYYFTISTSIKKVLRLVAGNISSAQINVIENYSNDIEIFAYGNDLTQCFLNIINNSKDSLIENNIDKKYILISTQINNDNTIEILLQDNAGGIPEEVLPKIFDEYFTTKESSKGTGLGLHMTHKIIVEHMKGKIEVINNNFNYENNNYDGALFKITLPIK